MKKRTEKLALKFETIRHLEGEELNRMKKDAAGVVKIDDGVACPWPTSVRPSYGEAGCA